MSQKRKPPTRAVIIMVHKPKERDKKHWLDYMTAGFALVAAIGSISAAFVGLLQWSVMSGQLESMRLDQRAWISFTMEIKDDLRFDDAGAEVGITLQLHDTGRVPATKVVPMLSLYPEEPGKSVGDISREPFCAGIGKSQLEQVVFPGEAKPFPVQATTKGWTPNNESKHGRAITHPVQLIISGCIRYQSGADPTLHCTGIFAMLMPTLMWDNNPFVLDPTKRDYVPTELHLMELPVHEYADDCDGSNRQRGHGAPL